MHIPTKVPFHSTTLPAGCIRESTVVMNYVLNPNLLLHFKGSPVHRLDVGWTTSVDYCSTTSECNVHLQFVLVITDCVPSIRVCVYVFVMRCSDNNVRSPNTDIIYPLGHITPPCRGISLSAPPALYMHFRIRGIFVAGNTLGRCLRLHVQFCSQTL